MKKRLLAVPTTTKSVVAKTQSEMKDVQVPKDRARGFDDIDEAEEDKPAKKAEPRRPVIITKVIKKSSATKAAAEIDDDDLDKIFSELDVIKELDEAELGIDDGDDTSFDDEEDLDMIADDEPEDYDDEDM
ncbi:MAG: hypothetical protein IPJ13_13625 [Saprospiraceae bacterium]|nr:hypothetical protein [Saprospiraceae bacterium]